MMNIKITGQQENNHERIEQVVKFYYGRLSPYSVQLLIDLKRLDSSAGDEQYRIHLSSIRKDGGRVEFFEIQKDLIHATQRALDRLVRHQLSKKEQHRFLGNF
jgi:hypothetical protein